LTFLLPGPKAGLRHEYVAKKLPIAEYSVVKKPRLASFTMRWPANRFQLAKLVAHRRGGEGWWRIPGSNR
jgi:hypothetical protein